MNKIWKVFGIVVTAAAMLVISLYANPRLYDANAQGPTPNDMNFSVMAVGDTNVQADWPGITHELSLYNSGTSTVYVDFIDGVATTANVPVYADMTINLKPFNNKILGAICGSGESTTLTVYAVRVNPSW